MAKTPAVWVYSTGDAFNRLPAGDSPAFITAAEAMRLERIRQARLLYQGKHRDYFIGEGRTQFDFPEVRSNDRAIQLYLKYNLLKLIAKKGADLLFGEEPIIRVDDEVQQAALATLTDRTSFHLRLYNAAIDCGYEAESFIESCVKNARVYVRAIDAGEMFPMGEPGADGQYEVYVRRQLAQLPGTNNTPIHFLLETTYAVGSIERRLWQLDEKGNKRLELTLENWPIKPIGEPLVPSSRTGIAMNLITWIPNELDHDKAVSDFDDLLDLQDELNAKQTQIGRVLAKHSDPKLMGPARAADPMGNFPTSHDMLWKDGDQDKWEYLVWNAELDAAMKDRAFTVNAMLIAAETSPVLLGLKEGAAPDAYRKLRLEAQNSITKAQRKGVNWKSAVRRILTICQALENVTPGNISYEQYPLSVEMRDGLGVDEVDQASTIAALRGARSMSQRRSVEIQVGPGAAADKEIAELEKEAAAATPSVLMGEPGETETNVKPTPEASTAAA